MNARGRHYYCLLSLLLGASVASARETFKAAVYEHAVIPPPPTTSPVSRLEALKHMTQNLKVYEEQAAIAGRKGVDILVFPEDGLYGINFLRRTLFPYLEYIPDPHTTTWSPCAKPDLYKNTDVQHALSCMAQENKLYLVANIGDKQQCSSDLDPLCPEDGHYQYNTAVAYGPDGTLLAKYHKTHLYHESQFDAPKPEEHRYFDTPFGRVGLAICFDFLFRSPVIPLVAENNVNIIAFPTAWMDSLPILSAIGYHSSIARGLHVDVLSANLHGPQERFHGSGIYARDGLNNFYYNRTIGSSPQLIVADVKIPFKPNDSRSKQRVSHTEAVSVNSETPLLDVPGKRKWHKSQSRNKTENSPSNSSSNVPFESRNFIFIALDTEEGNTQVCNGRVCCRLRYRYRRADGEEELFVLGALDGAFHDKYNMQTCSVLKCPSTDKRSCGSFTLHSTTIFELLDLRVSSQARWVFPQVVLDQGGQLALAPAADWVYHEKSSRIVAALKQPLVEATLIGRDTLIWLNQTHDL